MSTIQQRKEKKGKQGQDGEENENKKQVYLGPEVEQGSLFFGVCHLFAGFNDTFIHVTDMSGRETYVRIRPHNRRHPHPPTRHRTPRTVPATPPTRQDAVRPLPWKYWQQRLRRMAGQPSRGQVTVPHREGRF